MAETMLTLAVLQVVTPVVVAAMPAIWEQIGKVLRRVITKIGRDPSQDSNLACINVIMDTLDRLPNLSWTSEKPIQALLTQIKIKTDSLSKMIENDKALMRFIHKGKFAKNIQSVVIMMQLLETNIRVREATTFYQCNANCDVNTDRLDLNFYTQSQEDLIQDLLTILREDNLEPVQILTREYYEAFIERSGAFPRILYEFQFEGASGYPRTLSTSKGVRECIELLIEWLQNLKWMYETQNTAGSVLIGVAIYESFTEILPKVLMDHLIACSLTLHPRATQQFSKNLRFFRSFSKSSMFEAIQGLNGLQLEEEDQVLNIDLQQSEWVTWEDVQRMSLEVEMSSRDATGTTLENIELHECTICGLYIAETLLGNEFIQHWEACFRREQMCCPVCQLVMDHLSEEERALHTNVCLESCLHWDDDSGSDNDSELEY